MPRKSHGLRRKTRKKLQKRVVRIKDYLQEFEIGDLVCIIINPASKSIPHPRFQGLTAKVVEKRGKGYVIEFKHGKKIKRLTITSEHLKKVI